MPEIADRKLRESQVAGRANVLVFPDLNSGNIASKLVRTVGPRERLRPDFARPQPAGGGRVARFERARHLGRGRHHRRAGDRLPKALSGCRCAIARRMIFVELLNG